MDKSLQWLQEFFDVLNSDGAKLLMLGVFVVVSGIAMNAHNMSAQIQTVMISSFSGFSGAFLNALVIQGTLKGKSNVNSTVTGSAGDVGTKN